MGFSSRVLLVHDSHGQVKLNAKEIKTFQKIVDMLPRRWPELSSYRKRLIHTGSAPFKCRAGSRYLYVDEYGRVNWCSQTRTVWSKALMDYTPNDLREQFYSYKPCHATCTLNCSRSNSYFDNWRRQPSVNVLPPCLPNVESAHLVFAGHQSDSICQTAVINLFGAFEVAKNVR